MLTIEKLQIALKHIKEVSKILPAGENKDKVVELATLIEANLKLLSEHDPELKTLSEKDMISLEKSVELTEQIYREKATN